MVLRISLLLAVISIARVSGNTFIVTNTNDSGPGSLRQAITDANAHPNQADGEVIHFNIPGTGVHTITVISALPDIAEGVYLDGDTQPGFTGAPTVELTAEPGLAADGLRIAGGSTTILGLIINGFQNGIYIGPKGDNYIWNCYIGTDKTGTLSAPNDRGIVVSQAGYNEIGSAPAALRNVISGNRFEAIRVSQFDQNSTETQTVAIRGNYIGTDVTGTQALPNCSANASGAKIAAAVDVACRYAEIGGSGASGLSNVVSGNMATGISVSGIKTTVAGNLIGTTASGTAALPNTGSGIALHFVGEGTIGGFSGGDLLAGVNVISGNIGAGIYVDSEGATIRGNLIGTDISGKFAVPNGSGIVIAGRSHNLIGGSGFAVGNIISGNLGAGINFVSVASSVFPTNEIPPSDNIVQGNFIGTDITGKVALPNGGDGIHLGSGDLFGPLRNRIGGSTPSARNVISGNLGNGIVLARGAKDTRIQGNLIGTDVDGSNSLGNGQNGILIIEPSSNSLGALFGPNADSANTIAFNLRQGISFPAGPHTSGPQRISANSIHDNGQLGIDLDDDGATPNDPGDADTGPNDLQNFPVIGSAFGFNGDLTIYGSIQTAASQNFTLEFFGNSATDSSGFGEGRIFLGQANVATDSSGDASFNVTFPLPQNVAAVSATAIDPSGETSEFSAGAKISFTAPSPPPTSPTPVLLPTHGDHLLNISTRLRVEGGDHALIAGFIVTGDEPKKIIVCGIGPSLSQFNVPGVLADPNLELYRTDPFPAECVGRNDNWRSDQETEIQNTGLAPTNDFESALIRTVQPGNYTAVLRGKGETSGVGMVEVYDLSVGPNSRLGNISTRGLVSTGDNVMIAGFIVGNNGGGGTTVVLRAIGPSFALSSIPDALPDPILDLRDADGTLLDSNDDWHSAIEADSIRAADLAPSDDRESALYRSLGPGNYTAIVRGKGSASGVALVEVYDIGPQ